MPARAAASSASLLLLPAFALALNWPYLTSGFAGDDVILLNLLREGGAPPWWRGLWSVTDLPCFNSLWWAGRFAEGGFWRPVPSLVIQASIGAFGERAFPLHLLAIALHGATAVMLGLLTGRLLRSMRVGLLAGLLFVACEDHSMVVGWATTITDVLSTFFVVTALITHLAWLERRRAVHLGLSLAALVLALGSKESAVVTPLALAGLTVAWHARQSHAPGASHVVRDALRDRLAWLPAFAVLAVYVAAYRVLGFGVGSSQLYADPFSEPLTFLQHLVAQAPVLWLATLSPVPPSLAVFVPWTLPILAALGVGTFALFLLALFRGGRGASPGHEGYSPVHEPVVWWALLVYLLALLPQTGAEGGERALYLPMIPGSLLLAWLASQAGFVRRWVAPQFPVPSSQPRLARLAAAWVVFGVLLPGVVLSAAYAFMFKASFELPERQVRSLVALVRANEPEHVVALNTSGPFLTFYLGDELSWRVGRRVDTRILSSLNGVVTVERRGEQSITLRADRRGWLTNMFAMVPRTSAALEGGQVITTDLFTATVVQLAPGAGPADALAVRFDLAWAPGDPRFLVVTWTGTRFEELDLSSLPPGQRRLLADTSDVWASMR